MHFEDDVPRFMKMINEEGRLKCLARLIGGRITDCHGTNFFIPDSVDKSQNGSLNIAPKVRDGKAEDEKFENSIFSLQQAPDIFLLPNTMAAQPLEGKAGSRNGCPILSKSSLSNISDRGMTVERLQNRDGLGLHGPSGILEFPCDKGDRPNSLLGLNMGLGVLSSAWPKNSTIADGSLASSLGPCPSNSNGESQNSFSSDTSRSKFRSNELFSSRAKYKLPSPGNHETPKQ
ncbi:hypothetical protein Ancab_033403 [Ancistrocladus abbreviatus]